MFSNTIILSSVAFVTNAVQIQQENQSRSLNAVLDVPLVVNVGPATISAKYLNSDSALTAIL